jgi:GNAT superfamily N-acetyltransferase
MTKDQNQIEFLLNPDLTNEQLRLLFSDAWPSEDPPSDFSTVLSRSLGYFGAFIGKELVGFVNVAWDGGAHAFLLDPTVRKDMQRRGIGSELVRRAVELARSGGVEWMHVDFEPHLENFYRKCGFKKTKAGLIGLNPK